MEEFFSSYFRGDYMPHGHCYMWQPHILWMNVISDLIIAAAYFSIPIALLAFIKNRPDIEHRAVFILFSAFILMCGITHLMGIWTIWQGVYGIHGISKFTTAVVSMITAFSLYKLMPQFIKLPTIEQYEGIVNKWSDSQKENEFLSGQLQSQKLTQFVLDSIPISLLLVDDTGKVILSNSFYNKEFNDSEELSDVQISEIFHGNSADFKREFHQQHLFDQIDLGEQVKFIDSVKSGGTLVPVEVVITKKEYQQNEAFVITIKDLREITQIKQMLIDSNSRFERAVRATEEGLWEWDLEADKMIWSPRFYNMIGVSVADEPTQELWLGHVHHEYRADVNETLEQHLENGEKFYIEYIGRTASGEFGWFAISGNSIQGINGKPTLISGSLRYIEEEKQKEQKYDQKNRLLNAIYEGSSHAIWVVEVADNNEFKFCILNDTTVQIIGVEREKIIDKSIASLAGNELPELFVNHIISQYQTCIRSQKALEYVEKVEIAQPKWFQTTLFPIFDEDHKINMLVGTAVDITELKNIELQLEENSIFLENLINNSVCGLYVFDLTTNKNIRVNKRYQAILGYKQEDLDDVDDLMTLFHPDEHEMVSTHLAELGNSEVGTLIPLEYRFKHKDGNWVWCYSIDSVLNVDEQGNPTQILGTFVDVTEKNELLSRLKESNAYLEQFAFVASHDLQEPLRKITAFSESLSTRLAPLIEHDEDSKFELTRMESAATRMSTMINDLLELSRINSQNISLSKCSLSAIVDEVKDMLEITIDEKQAVVTCDNSVGEVYADRGLMVQLLQNLISNSLKFCQEQTVPEINIRSEYFDDRVEVYIEDNGIGMEQEHLETIFEPFRRLHGQDKYDGSGIGLAIVNQIALIHKGCIDAESAIGEGSQFKLTLPRASI